MKASGRLVLLGLALWVSSLGIFRAAASAQDATLEGYFAHAATARTRSQTRRARIYLERAIARAPADARGPLQLGALLLPTELPRAPLSAATRADIDTLRDAIRVALGPPAVQDAETALALRRMDAWAEAVRGELESAIQNAGRACARLDEETATMLRHLARAAIERDNLALADTALDTARRCNAASIESTWDLATVRLARGRTEQAITLMREVVQRRPGDIVALRDLAGALLAAGESADALHLYSDIAVQCATEVRCQLDLGRAALEARAYDRGVAAAEEARRHANGNDPEPSLLLGAIHLARGARREATDAFRDALTRAPNNARALEGLRNLEGPAATGDTPRNQ